METDEQLFKLYQLGFKDELDGTISFIDRTPLQEIAYELGRIDAVIGDEMRAIDYRTKEETIKIIRTP